MKYRIPVESKDDGIRLMGTLYQTLMAYFPDARELVVVAGVDSNAASYELAPGNSARMELSHAPRGHAITIALYGIENSRFVSDINSITLLNGGRRENHEAWLIE